MQQPQATPAGLAQRLRAWFARTAPGDAGAPDPAAPDTGDTQASQPLAPTGPGNAEEVLQRLEWSVIRRLDGLLQGDYRSLFRGFGLDLADLREYQANDDVRFIDWNVTARMDTPYVREFQEDREITCWFLVDLSASVDFGSQLQTKRDLAARVVAVLSRMLTRHGNQVGAVLYTQAAASAPGAPRGSKLHLLDAVVPPRHGRRQVLTLIDRIQQVGRAAGAAHAAAPAGLDAGAPGAVAATSSAPPLWQDITDLSQMIDASRGAIKRRSMVIVVSDFITRSGWERALALLAQRHEVLAVRLHDPVELQLPDIGQVTLVDPETGEQLHVDCSDARLRERFAALAAGREQALTAAMLEAGVDCLALSTDEDLAQALLRLVQMRKRRRRHA